MKRFAIIALLAALTSCGKPYVFDYGHNTGYTAEFRPNESIEKTWVTIDDSITVAGKTLKNLKVLNLSPGEHTVRIKTNSTSYKQQFDKTYKLVVSEKGETKLFIIDRPPYSGEYWAITIVSIAAGLGLSALLISLF